MSQQSGLSGRNSRLGAGAKVANPSQQPTTVDTETSPAPDSPLQVPTHLAVQNSESYWSPASQKPPVSWKKKTKYFTQI
jgi:hypothetical protein